MFKKTKVRSILELLGKNLSAREVSKVLGVSRNTALKYRRYSYNRTNHGMIFLNGMTTGFMNCSIRISLNINPDMLRLIILTSIES